MERLTPDFSGHPDLVVMMLGLRVRTLFGVRTLLGLGPQITKAGESRPDGLLHAENNILYSLRPLHVGMRWYWRDADSLEAWARSEPHRIWWADFMRGSGGTGIWHETYHMRGGMEAIYSNVAGPVGFGCFLPMIPARGSMRSRHRAASSGDFSGLPEANPPGP